MVFLDAFITSNAFVMMRNWKQKKKMQKNNHKIK